MLQGSLFSSCELGLRPSSMKAQNFCMSEFDVLAKIVCQFTYFFQILERDFCCFLLVKLVKKLGNLSDFGKSMSTFARKSETDIQKQTVRI